MFILQSDKTLVHGYCKDYCCEDIEKLILRLYFELRWSYCVGLKYQVRKAGIKAPKLFLVCPILPKICSLEHFLRQSYHLRLQHIQEHEDRELIPLRQLNYPDSDPIKSLL